MAFVENTSLFNFPEGDLPIIVTHRGQQITGRVSSKALCLASPVFEKFIYPPFGRLSPAKNEPPVTCTGREKSQTEFSLEEKPAMIAKSVEQNECADCDIIENGVKNCKLASTKSNQEVAPGLMFGGHIDFQEDNAESLRLLFQIAHFQFNKVPLKLQFDTLLGIAHLCEIYQCVHLVLPWLDSWLEGGMKECAEAGKEEYLFIAWSFGRADLFTECANNLINEVYLIDGLPAVNRGFVRYLDDIEGLPPKAIEAILQARTAKLERLLDIPYKTARDILSSRLVLSIIAGALCLYQTMHLPSNILTKKTAYEYPSLSIPTEQSRESSLCSVKQSDSRYQNKFTHRDEKENDLQYRTFYPPPSTTHLTHIQIDQHFQQLSTNKNPKKIKINITMEALLLATLLTPTTASPLPHFPPPLLLHRTDPESGLANGATDTGPSVSPFGWALVGVFGVGVLVIIGFTVRLRLWYKWFPRAPLASVEGGRVGAGASTGA